MPVELTGENEDAMEDKGMARFQSLVWRFRVSVAVLFVGLLSVAVAVSARDPVAEVNVTDGLAIKGYDPVAYFTTGQPTPGLDTYTVRWQGVTYRFASAENQARFEADPAQYLPQYGGYCAYAMSLNRIADIDPERWAIVDGKLYLNNGRSAYTLWSINKSGNIADADRHWPAYPKLDRTP